MPSYTSKLKFHIPFFKKIRHEESCKSLLTWFNSYTMCIAVTIGLLSYQNSNNKTSIQNSTNIDSESNDATNKAVAKTTTTTIPTRVLATSVSMPEGKDQQHLHSPISPWRIIRPNPLLEICYDTRTRNPIYVQYKLVVATTSDPSSDTNNNDNEIDDDRTIDDSKGIMQHHQQQSFLPSITKKHYNFYEDTSIEEMYRSRNSYYHNSGYDRGHLAPAADFAYITSNSSQQPQQQQQQEPYQYLHDTYNLCNISPQYSNLNRIVWNQLEQLVRKLAKYYWYNEQNAVTYVTTGPIYIPKQQINNKQFQYMIHGIGIPPCIIMVPTHFYKVIVVLDSTETKILYFACFVLPNDPNVGTTTNNNSTNNKSTLLDYIVPWTDLEAVTGLLFYPDLVDEQFKLYADTVTQNLVMKNQVSLSSFRDNHNTIQSGPRPLLITDGTESKVGIINNSNINHSNNSKSFLKQQQHHKYKHIQHLCVNDACIPRKQQQQQQQQRRS